jgi:hypothetical protein
MKKRLSEQNAPGGAVGHRTGPGEAASQGHPKTDPAPAALTQQPGEACADSEKTVTAGGRTFKTDVKDLDKDLKNLVCKMLTEGSTFEDVVEAVNERGDGITLNAVQNYFQGNREIQTKRVRHLVKSAETLLATVDKDPKSAEARLARATFLTGYLRVRRDASLITPKEAEHVRMERENLSLKRRILIMQKEKAVQAMKYSQARTRFIVLTQEKLKEEILGLQQEAKGHHAGEPMGPEMLQKIQQLYGLACQPLLYEESADVTAKA